MSKSSHFSRHMSVSRETFLALGSAAQYRQGGGTMCVVAMPHHPPRLHAAIRTFKDKRGNNAVPAKLLPFF